MTQPVTDIWLRSGLRLAEIARRLALRDVIEDSENYWEWVIGTLGEVRMDISRTHTRLARRTDRRIFLLGTGEFAGPLIAELVGR